MTSVLLSHSLKQVFLSRIVNRRMTNINEWTRVFMIEPNGDQFLNFLTQHESFLVLFFSLINRIEESLSLKNSSLCVNTDFNLFDTYLIEKNVMTGLLPIRPKLVNYIIRF